MTPLPSYALLKPVAFGDRKDPNDTDLRAFQRYRSRCLQTTASTTMNARIIRVFVEFGLSEDWKTLAARSLGISTELAMTSGLWNGLGRSRGCLSTYA